MSVRLKLVIASATMLFVELALIRWTGANVIHLSYFSNFILLGSFLGIGLGFLIPADRGRWLTLLAPVPLALLVIYVVAYPVQIRQSSRDIIYFTGVKPTGFPEWVTLPILFALTAAAMAAIGKIVADVFRQLPSLDAYRYDLLGSLAGTALFTLTSLLRAPSFVWGAIAGVALFVLAGRRSTRLVYGGAMTVVVVLLVLESLGSGVSWSPYYKLTTKKNGSDVEISANGVPHQAIERLALLEDKTRHYQQAYVHTPNNPHQRVLIIGAGNGNDIALALRHGASYVDAVEIDPRIQEIGAQLHPQHPYDDPRVHVHINDGRAFLQQHHGNYDLEILALPDSLTLVAGASNLRLESYLFTREAFAAARRALAPHGAFVMYNLYRQTWLIDRYGGSLAEAFGHPACVDNYGTEGALAVFVVGNTPSDQTCDRLWAPSGVVPASVTDDRPFTYLRTPTIPRIYLGVLAAILAVSLVLIRLTGAHLRPMVAYTDMFFMGAAFLLLETKNVIGFALYFGTTWLVNALVFFGVLLAVLAALEVRRRVTRVSQPWLQMMLFATIAVAWAVPASWVLGLNAPLRLVVAIALAFAPIFCANIIFSDRLAAAKDPTSAFGANLLGALTGGTLEYLALVTGYRALLLVVAGLYAVAFVAMRRLGRPHTGTIGTGSRRVSA